MGYELRRIVASGQAEQLVCATVHLPRPAIAILEARKTVLIDRADTTLEAVLLQGRLRVAYFYPVQEPPGQPGPASGPVWSTTTDLGFTLAVTAPGARPEMESEVADAFVTASVLSVAEADSRGAIRSVADRSILFITVRVVDMLLVDGPQRAVGGRTSPGGTPPEPARAAGPTAAIGRYPPPRKR
jgi:hypothetical protein